MPSRATTNRDAIAQREADALANLSELIERLEAVGDRCKVSEGTYYSDVADRDTLAWEAWQAGLTQELIGQVSGLGSQPAVVRAIKRAKARGRKDVVKAALGRVGS